MGEILTAPRPGPLAVTVKADDLILIAWTDYRQASAQAELKAGAEAASRITRNGWLLEATGRPGEAPGYGYQAGDGNIQLNNFTARTSWQPAGGSGARGIPCISLHLPPGSSLTAEISSGSVTVSGEFPLSAFTARAMSADVTLAAPAGNVDVDTHSGYVSLMAAIGATRVATISGDVEVAEARGDLGVRTVSGSVDVTAPVIVRMRLGSMSGRVTAGVPRGGEGYVKAESGSRARVYALS